MSPPEELKIEDFPNGFAVFESAFFSGWVQILAIVGTIDCFNLQSEPTKYPGDDELFSALGMHEDGSIEDNSSCHRESRTQCEVTAYASSGRAT